MTEYTLEKAPEGYGFTLLPDDRVFLAEVTEIEEGDSPFWVDRDDHSKGKDQWVSFRFKILDDDSMTDDDITAYVGKTVFGNTRPEFVDHPDCKLRNWVAALLGLDEIPQGFKLQLNDLEGQLAKITIFHRKGNNGKTYQNVGDVIPAVDTGGEAPDVF